MPIVRQPLLQMTKQAASYATSIVTVMPQAGDTIEYVIQIHNNGNDTAQRVTINDIPDAATILKKGSVRTSQGAIINGNETGDTLGGLARGSRTSADAETSASDPVTSSKIRYQKA
jgi:uncharacterized repeat protein (TIGR01451 family)